MSYTQQTWANLDPSTPLSADRLAHIESGISAVDTALATKVPLVANTGQSYSAVATDQSATIQALIDTAGAAYLAGTAGSARAVVLPSGVFYGALKMRPGVILKGQGYATILRAMPGQTAPVIDYATYDAYHSQVKDLRVDGNYLPGRTDGITQGACRAIDMSSSASDVFAYPLPGQTSVPGDYGPTVFTGYWDNPANTIADVSVFNAGGDIAVYIGMNQRAAQTHNLFIENCKALGMKIVGTDTFHTNLDVGNCGDGILIRGIATKLTGFKSWYHGRNSGFNTGKGDGVRVDVVDPITGATTAQGEVLLIGETQDNARYGWAFINGRGHVAKGTSSGDATGSVFLGADGGSGTPAVRGCDISIVQSYGGSSNPALLCGVTIDTGAIYNTVDVITDPVGADASYKPVKFLNSGSASLNDVSVTHGAKRGYIDVGVAAGTYNPVVGYGETFNMTVNDPSFAMGASVNSGYRREVTFRITTGSVGAVAWDTSWGSAPYVQPGRTTTVTFINTATTSDVPVWVCRTANQPTLTSNSIALNNRQPLASVGTWAMLANGTAYALALFFNSTDAQNDSITYGTDLAKGTYTISVNGLSFSTAAIATVDMSFDGGASWTNVGTIDFYAVSTAQKRANLVGFVVPKTGPAQIRFKAATRNASNTTHWFLELCQCDFTQTA